MAGAPAGHDVFLSYSRADAAAAETLRARLRDAGLTAFLDRYALPADRPWQPELEAALASCRALLVLLGPAGIGGWQHREIQLALDRQNRAPFPVVPVLLPGLQPDDLPLGTFLALNTWVDLRQGLDEPEAQQRLLAALQGRAIDGLTRDLAGLHPYRGLLAFREQDAGLFFGRERFVDELTAKVRQRSAANVVAVLGRSGSGKSSVVFAGLLPALRQEKGAGQQAIWQILDLRPGAEPLHALTETFDPPDEGLTRAQKLASINGDVELLRHRKLTLAQLVRDRLKDDPGTTRLLLYVDQWEELYTQAQPREPKTDEEKARAADARLFTDLVIDAAAKSPCTLVLSVRSDFYPDLQTHDALRAAVQDCQVSLGPMTATELTDAIEGPAKAVGCRVEAELTRKLLRDIGIAPAQPQVDYYDSGKLPLLGHALKQVWAKTNRGRLRLANYRGLEHALEERANDIYDRLSPERQTAAKRLFMSLVTLGEGREDTRARISLSGDRLLEEVVAAFSGSDARLIVAGDDVAGARSVEVSHEALIRHWDKLRAWIDDNRPNLRMRADLVAARDEWLKHGQRADLLISSGLRLERARKLREEPGDVTTGDIVDYIDASLEADVAMRESAEAARLAKEHGDETQAAIIWSGLEFEPWDSPRSQATVKALWQLASATAAVRDSFLRQLASHRSKVDTLASAPFSIARAFGLRPDGRAIQRLLGPVLDTFRLITEPATLPELARAVHALGPTPEQAQTALQPVLDALRKTTDEEELVALAQAAHWLGPTSEQAQAALQPFLDAIRGTNYPFVTFGQAVTVLGPKLTPEQAHGELGPIVAAMQRTTSRLQLLCLAHTVEILGSSLTAEHAQIIILPFLETIRKIAKHGRLWNYLNCKYSSIPSLKIFIHLVGTGNDIALARFVTSTVSDYERLERSAIAVKVLGSKLAPDNAQVAIRSVLYALRKIGTHTALKELASALQALRPAPWQNQAAFRSVTSFRARSWTLSAAIWRALAVEALSPTPKQAQFALRRILRNLRQRVRPTLISKLISALSSDSKSSTSDDPTLQAVAQVVQALGPKLASSDAQTALPLILDAFRLITEPATLPELARAVHALGPTPEQAQTALGPVLDALRKTTDYKQRLALAESVQLLVPKLDSSQAASTIEVVRTLLSSPNAPDVAAAFARTIAQALPADPAGPYVTAIVELLKWPTAGAPDATEALLDVLHERVPDAPSKEAGLGATVEWVARAFPDIDLDSPPIPPASGSTGAAW